MSEDLSNEAFFGRQFDCISALNLLDRCDRPRTFLKQIRNHLKPGGILFIALVIPCRPSVETSSGFRKPKERIHAKGDSFEECMNSFFLSELKPLGFVVKCISKVPYISQGDYYNSIYLLSDSLWVLGLK